MFDEEFELKLIGLDVASTIEDQNSRGYLEQNVGTD
jgi:hypothetical protein